MSKRQLVEFVGGAALLGIAVILAARLGVDMAWPFGLWLGGLCLVIAVEDVRHLRVADSANLLLFAGGCAWRLLEPAPQATMLEALAFAWLASAICGGALLALQSLHARKAGRIGLGLGDVKLCAAAAAWTGLAAFPIMLLVASLSALAVVAFMSFSRSGWSRDQRLPFAAFLAPALFVIWFADVATFGSISPGLLQSP